MNIIAKLIENERDVDGHCEYWKWHGSVVNSPLYQTTYEQENISGDTSDDLPRTQACCAQYP